MSWLAEREPYNEVSTESLSGLYIKTGQKVKAVDAAHAFSKRIEKRPGLHASIRYSVNMNKKSPVLDKQPKSSDDTASFEKSISQDKPTFMIKTESSGEPPAG